MFKVLQVKIQGSCRFRNSKHARFDQSRRRQKAWSIEMHFADFNFGPKAH